MPAASTPGLYGKIPSQGDFLRANVVDPAAVEFSRWLEEAQEGLYRTQAALPALPVCFVHAVPQARTALVGALLPSRDAVGRVFPFAAFLPVDAGQLARSYPRAPLAFSMFLGEVARLGRDSATLAAPAVLERIRQLPLPGLAEWSLADEVAERLLDQPASGLLASLGEPPSGAAYGLRTFLSACAAEAGELPSRVARVVLECPLAGEGPAVWLELARRVLRWRSPPPFLWTEAAPPRLLLCLGAPPPSLLGLLARPDPRSNLVWPLRTTQRTAAETALAALTPEQRTAVSEPDRPLRELFSAFLQG
ncbi:MAG TPA: type VI secretion system-associated protein TagF [Myxococcaceae bacterium]